MPPFTFPSLLLNSAILALHIISSFVNCFTLNSPAVSWSISLPTVSKLLCLWFSEACCVFLAFAVAMAYLPWLPSVNLRLAPVSWPNSLPHNIGYAHISLSPSVSLLIMYLSSTWPLWDTLIADSFAFSFTKKVDSVVSTFPSIASGGGKTHSSPISSSVNILKKNKCRISENAEKSRPAD